MEWLERWSNKTVTLGKAGWQRLQTYYQRFKEYYQRLGNYERRCLEAGIISGIIFAIIMLGLGIALVPFSGGASLVGVIFLDMLYVLFMAAVWGAAFKYVGRSIDTVIEIKQEGKTSNQKIAALCGCVIGLVLAIFTACFPILPLIAVPHLGLVDIAQLVPWQQLMLMVLGMVGAMSSATDKLGQFCDIVFQRTPALDAFYWIRYKLFNVPIPVQAKQDKAESSWESIKRYFREMVNNKDGKRYEKIGVLVGVIVGPIAAIILISLGINILPFVMETSSVIAEAALNCVYIVLSAAIWGASFKYIGRSLDVFVDLMDNKHTLDEKLILNQKLAGVGGCVVGLAIALLMILEPVMPVFNLPQMWLMEGTGNVIQKAVILLTCMPGFVASAADKLGQWLDTKLVTKRDAHGVPIKANTVLELGRFFGRWVKRQCFASEEPVVECEEQPVPLSPIMQQEAVGLPNVSKVSSTFYYPQFEPPNDGLNSDNNDRRLYCEA